MDVILFKNNYTDVIISAATPAHSVGADSQSRTEYGGTAGEIKALQVQENKISDFRRPLRAGTEKTYGDESAQAVFRNVADHSLRRDLDDHSLVQT